MQLPNLAMLQRRIAALVNAGVMPAAFAQRLLAENQADERNRAGMIWFCFFPPRIAGEDGIGRLFRSWGAEAPYNSCLVEGDVHINTLEPAGRLDFNITLRYLIYRGFETRESVDHENRAKQPLGSDCIPRVIAHPEPEFVALTDCGSWDSPLIEQISQ